MALFTARPRRAGTKGATPAAVQYIPHAEQGLVPEPWAKSTVPLALSDGGEKGGGRVEGRRGEIGSPVMTSAALHWSCCERAWPLKPYMPLT